MSFLLACGVLKMPSENRIVSGAGQPPSEKVAEIPFTRLLGGLLLVKLKINDFPDSLNFILDTGNGALGLDSATADRLDLDVLNTAHVPTHPYQKAEIPFVKNLTLHFPSMVMDSMEAYVRDYSLLSAGYGIRIDGFLGYSFFKDRIVRIDYDQEKIFLFSSGEFTYPKGGTLLNPWLKNIPLVDGEVGNKPARARSRFYFDTGGGLHLILPQRLVRDSGFFELAGQRRRAFVQTENLGFSGKMTMTKTVISDFKLGPYTFKRVPVFLYEDSDGLFSYPSVGGLIGNDLLRHFNVILNYPEKEIFIKPNSHFKEKFDYSYTGLNLELFEGHILITNVQEDSPGREAGLRAGDLVLSVDGDASGDLTQYRRHLRRRGRKVKVQIYREEKVLTKKLKVGSLL